MTRRAASRYTKESIIMRNTTRGAVALGCLIASSAAAETVITPIWSAPITLGGPPFILQPFPDSPAVVQTTLSFYEPVFSFYCCALSGSNGLTLAGVESFAIPNCDGFALFSSGGLPALPNGTLVNAALPLRLDPAWGRWFEHNFVVWDSYGDPPPNPVNVAFKVSTPEGDRFGWISYEFDLMRAGSPYLQSITPVAFGIETGLGSATLVGVVDCNGNGINDSDECNDGAATDCNQDLVPDECQPQDDCDGNGVTDLCDIGSGAQLDLDLNLVPDACQIAADPSLDCNGDGLLDTWQIKMLVLIDCNLNGVPDSCEIALDPQLDCNGDGLLDYCCPDEDDHDCDGDGVPDLCQIATDPGLDCNGNKYLDACEWWNDCDGDGIPDSCESLVDFNGNGVNDYCEHLGDIDGDGVVGPSDLAALFAMWGVPCRCHEDLNADYEVNATDLAILLGFWTAR